MSTKFTYYSVKLEDVSALMKWGRMAMQSGISDDSVGMKISMMVIFDKTVIEKGNDEDELLVMTIGRPPRGITSKHLSWHVDLQNDTLLLDILKPAAKEHDILPDHVQDATLVYILV